MNPLEQTINEIANSEVGLWLESNHVTKILNEMREEFDD